MSASAEADDRCSLHALVRGYVQGVNFRQFVYARARTMRLTGYVRNLPDGQTVEIIAEGPRSELDQLAKYLRDGPRSARVEGLEVEWGEATQRWTDFAVLD